MAGFADLIGELETSKAPPRAVAPEGQSRGFMGLARNTLFGAMDVLSLDPLAEPEVWGEGHLRFVDPHVFVIATKHEQFRTIHFPKGSVVIDPWGYISGGEGVTVIRVGRK